MRLRSEFLACANSGLQTALTAALSPEAAEIAAFDWPLWARDDQLPPCAEADGFRTWVVIGGRGAGKTRAGAEWVRAKALGLSPLGLAPPAAGPVSRIALIGETLADVRSVMIEGISGLLAIHMDHERPRFEPSKRMLTWPNGTIAQMFSADDPESLRGPQFDTAWCDEVCKWRHAEAAWDMLQFGLRLGDVPQQVVTTTPRNMPLLKRLLGEAGSIVSRMRTTDNAANLSAAFLETVTARYRGTRLGRQELDGEILEDREDALWQRDWIEAGRVEAVEAGERAFQRIVVAVDPPVTSGKNSDACGIVVGALGGDGRGFVLADCTVQGVKPLAWAKAAVAAYHRFEADALVAEVNQGGELVATVIGQVDAAVPVRMVRATRGKWVRAEPVAALYAQGRVVHAGVFPALEDQLCDFGPEGLSGGGSPDRLDALVWCMTDLMRAVREPRIRAF